MQDGVRHRAQPNPPGRTRTWCIVDGDPLDRAAAAGRHGALADSERRDLTDSPFVHSAVAVVRTVVEYGSSSLSTNDARKCGNSAIATTSTVFSSEVDLDRLRRRPHRISAVSRCRRPRSTARPPRRSPSSSPHESAMARAAASAPCCNWVFSACCADTSNASAPNPSIGMIRRDDQGRQWRHVHRARLSHARCFSRSWHPPGGIQFDGGSDSGREPGRQRTRFHRDARRRNPGSVAIHGYLDRGRRPIEEPGDRRRLGGWRKLKDS